MVALVADKDDRYISLLLEEYKGLSVAAENAGRNTYVSLQWGSAVMAVLVAAAVSQWRKHDAAIELVFFLAVPFLSSMAMLFVIGELARIRRLADFMCATEIKAKYLAGEEGTEARISDAASKEIAELELSLGIRLPVPVPVDPLSWQRWLVELRKQRAGAAFGHLSWVYRARLGLFPIATFSSLTVATYYTFSSDTTPHHATESYLMLAVGFTFSIIVTWLAIELALELARVTAYPEKAPGWPRRIFRHAMGWLFDIGDWAHPPLMRPEPESTS